jgi:putative ABC transport system permease protein
MIRLAFAYLRERRLTSALNILLMAIPVAMLALLLRFSRQAEDNVIKGAEGIDLVIGAKGSPLQVVLSSVYHLDQPTGNTPDARRVARTSNAAAIPLALGDSFSGFRMVGTENAFLDLYEADLAKERAFKDPMEVVIGAMARQTGAGLGQVGI